MAHVTIIVELKSTYDRQEWTSTHRVDPNKTDWVIAQRSPAKAVQEEALHRAVKKHFGAGTFWLPDSEGTGGFGQVFERLPKKLGGGNTSVTGRLRVTFIHP